MSVTNLDALFQPFALKSLALKNRIVMAPMTRSFPPPVYQKKTSPPIIADVPNTTSG